MEQEMLNFKEKYERKILLEYVDPLYLQALQNDIVSNLYSLDINYNLGRSVSLLRFEIKVLDPALYKKISWESDSSYPKICNGTPYAKTMRIIMDIRITIVKTIEIFDLRIARNLEGKTILLIGYDNTNNHEFKPIRVDDFIKIIKDCIYNSQNS